MPDNNKNATGVYRRNKLSKILIPPLRCKAKSTRSGEQCKNHALVGAVVCNSHGGAAPQVREGARKRMARMADDAVEGMMQLAGISGSGLGAISESVRQRALADILDRAGFKPTDRLEVSDSPVTNETLDEAIREALNKRLGDGEA